MLKFKDKFGLVKKFQTKPSHWKGPLVSPEFGLGCLRAFVISVLKAFKDSGSVASLGSLFLGLVTLQVYMQSENLLLQFMVIVSCSHTMKFSGGPGSVLLSPCRYWQAVHWSLKIFSSLTGLRSIRLSSNGKCSNTQPPLIKQTIHACDRPFLVYFVLY